MTDTMSPNEQDRWGDREAEKVAGLTQDQAYALLRRLAGAMATTERTREIWLDEFWSATV